MEHHPRLKAAIIEVVQTQIESNEPPETNQTFNRLIAEGFTEKEAKELLGFVVSAEVFEILKVGKPFDIKRYVAALNRLPEVPE